MKYIKKYRTNIIITITVILIFLSSFLLFTSQVNHANTKNSKEYLDEVGNQIANQFDLRLRDSIHYLSSISDIIYSIGDIEMIDQLINNYINQYSFIERVIYISDNLKGYDFENRSFINFSNTANPLRYVNENIGITDSFYVDYLGYEVTAIYTQIEKQKGDYLLSIIPMNSINEEFINSQLFDSDTYFYILDNQGNIVTQSSVYNPLLIHNNIYEIYSNDNIKFSSSSFEEMKDNISKRLSGNVQYTLEDQNRIAQYTPLNESDWYVLTVVNSKFIKQQNQIYNNISMQLVFVIVTLSLSIMFYIIYCFNKNNEYILSMTKTLKNNKFKLELLLHQTSERIFEFQPDYDRLTLDAWNDNPNVVFNHFLFNLHNYNFFSKEHEELFVDAINRMIKGEDKVSVDVKIPFISKNYDTWYHISMFAIRQPNSPLKIMGTLRNSTKEMEEYNELVKDQIFKNSLYSEALNMFAVNLKSSHVVITQKDGEYEYLIDQQFNQEFINSFYSNLLGEDFVQCYQFFNLDYIRSLYHNNSFDNSYRLDVRIVTPENETKWIRIKTQIDRTTTNELMLIAYAQDINTKKLEQIAMEDLAMKDRLTGLLNRQTFNKYVQEHIDTQNIKTLYSAYCIIDLDYFKEVNDDLGHSKGDELLCDVAQILNKYVNKFGYVGRFGGDEFVLFLSNCESKGVIEEVARNINKSITQIKIDNEHFISASIGITFLEKEETFQELFDKSDKALYQCKENGKNGFIIYRNNS